ncbi:MAG: hypothetical protein ACRC2T_05430, partial [Thermoguttaceae bacterium]
MLRHQSIVKDDPPIKPEVKLAPISFVVTPESTPTAAVAGRAHVFFFIFRLLPAFRVSIPLKIQNSSPPTFACSTNSFSMDDAG